MFCGNCGTENEDGAKFCRGCGKPLEEAAGNAAESTEVNAAPQQEAVSPANAETAPAEAPTMAAPPPVPATTPTVDPTAIPGAIPAAAPGAAPAMAPGAVPQQVANKQPVNLKVLLPIIIGGCAALVALLIIVLVVVTRKPTIKLDDYLTIEAYGYDGYGTAAVIIDWDGIEEKYGDKLKLTSQAEDDFGWFGFMIEPIDVLKTYISVNLEDVDIHSLSNGDVIEYTWNVDEELYTYVKCKTKCSDGSYTVEGLEAVGTFDAFADLEVNFYGVSPYASVEYNYTGSQLSNWDFSFDRSNGLRNGDTVTVSISNTNVDYYIQAFGMLPVSFEKEYTVSGLDEYVDSYDKLSDDFIAELKSEAEDTIYAYTAGSYNVTSSMTDLTYAGYIFNMRKDDGYSGYINVTNELYVIYSGIVSSSAGNFNTAKVYFPVKFTNILSGENGLSYEANGGIDGNSRLDGSRSFSTSGYVNPLTCYMNLVEAKRDNFTSACGDGFEVYAEYDLITALADIGDEYKEVLYADAKDRILSYIASENSLSSIYYLSGTEEISDLEFIGEYLLLAKTQGTDFANNNKYIIVYSATVTNSQGKFNPTTVYFPVEYDGIVKLPGDEYMVTSTVGLDSNRANVPSNSYYTYYTRGYTDGAEMYSKLVTANRDNYTYEVSEGLKQFGE